MEILNQKLKKKKREKSSKFGILFYNYIKSYIIFFETPPSLLTLNVFNGCPQMLRD